MSIGLDRSCVAKRLVVLAVPTTPQLRDHQEIHHRKADKAGQEAFLNDTANQPPRIQHADHQLSKPDEPSEEQHGLNSVGGVDHRHGGPTIPALSWRRCTGVADSWWKAGTAAWIGGTFSGTNRCPANPAVDTNNGNLRSVGRSSNGSVNAWRRPVPREISAAAGLCSKWIVVAVQAKPSLPPRDALARWMSNKKPRHC